MFISEDEARVSNWSRNPNFLENFRVSFFTCRKRKLSQLNRLQNFTIIVNM